MAFLFWKKKKPSDDAVSTAEVETAEPEVIEATAVAAEPEFAEAASEIEVAIQETEAVVEPAVVEVVAVQLDEAPEVVAQPEPEPEPELVAVELPKRSARKGIRSLFSRIKFDPTDLDALEDVLLTADFGINASAQIVDQVKATAKQTGAQTEAELKQILADVIASNLEREDKALNLSDGKLPYVFLVVGVNGVGKTTTIGKLANWLREGEWDVVIGAADTFRAAAVDQIATWADRAGAKLVRPKIEGQDPASVAFEATETAVKDDADILIIDTAGRLQNKADLMQELDKIRRVVEKTAQISEVLLVLDATTGQNGLTQAKAFAEVANVTGVVLTKLDGTARGGIVYSIQRELNIPVKLVGVGEGIDDFAFFDATEFAAGLVS